MIPLEISFEVQDTPQYFAHIKSADGLLGHAAEIQERVPAGVWLCVQPEYKAGAEYLVRKAGFIRQGYVKVGGELCDLLLKVA